MDRLPLGLLKFCLEHGEVRGDSAGIPIRDPADYAWLREALDSTADSGVRITKQAIEVLQRTDPAPSAGELAAALETLQDQLEDLNIASDLSALGGVEPIVACLAFASATHVRFWAAWCVSTAVHGLPKVRAAMLAAGALERVIERLTAEEEVHVREKVWAALCSLILNDAAAEATFFDHHGGLDVLRASCPPRRTCSDRELARVGVFASNLSLATRRARADALAHLFVPILGALSVDAARSRSVREPALHGLVALAEGGAVAFRREWRGAGLPTALPLPFLGPDDNDERELQLFLAKFA